MPERSRLTLAPLALCTLLVLCFFLPWQSASHSIIPKTDLRISQSGFQAGMGWGTLHMKGQRTYVSGMDVNILAWVGLVLPLVVVVLAIVHHRGKLSCQVGSIAFMAAGALGLVLSLAASNQPDFGRDMASAYRVQKLQELPLDFPADRRRAVEAGMEQLLTALRSSTPKATIIVWGNAICWAAIAMCGALPLSLSWFREQVPVPSGRKT